MTRFSCRRCEWSPDRSDNALAPQSQAADHAADSGHPCCVVCSRSLEVAELQTCAECVATVRSNLAGIVERYALLPGEYGHATATPPDAAGAPHGDETRLPGGDVLALLAGGSAGTLWRGRPVTDDDLNQYADLWRCVLCQGNTTDRGRHLRDVHQRVDWSQEHHLFEHAGYSASPATRNHDEIPSDPPSVAFELARWEDDLRLTRREPAATEPATVVGAAHYINARLGWAANHHPAFDELADDLRKLHRKLLEVTGASERPQVGAPCFDCGADLVRQYGEEHYRCPRCRREYDDPSYWLAIRAELEREA